MTGITFVYGDVPAAPVSTDLTAESAGHWADDSTTHTVSRSTTYAHSGTYSFKVIATDAGSASTGYAYLPSANNATFTVGTQYVIFGWIRGDANRSVYIKTGGVTSDAIDVTDSGWTLFVFAFTALTATTDLQIWASDTLTFYFDDLSVREGIHFSTPRMVRGFDEPDEVEFWPELQHSYLDGSLEDQLQSFRRRITVATGVVQDSTTRKSLLKWLLDTGRSWNYGTETGITVALENPAGFANEWKQGLQYGRSYTFVGRETTVRTSFPV